jgi:hypothetical protein
MHVVYKGSDFSQVCGRRGRFPRGYYCVIHKAIHIKALLNKYFISEPETTEDIYQTASNLKIGIFLFKIYQVYTFHVTHIAIQMISK